jgi:hypothetical protein
MKKIILIVCLLLLFLFLRARNQSPCGGKNWQQTQCNGLAHKYCAKACSGKVIDSTLKDAAICFRCVDSAHDLCIEMGCKNYNKQYILKE